MTTTVTYCDTTYIVEWEIEEVVETHGSDFHEFSLNGYVKLPSTNLWELMFQATGSGFDTDIEEVHDIQKV